MLTRLAPVVSRAGSDCRRRKGGPVYGPFTRSELAGFRTCGRPAQRAARGGKVIGVSATSTGGGGRPVLCTVIADGSIGLFSSLKLSISFGLPRRIPTAV